MNSDKGGYAFYSQPVNFGDKHSTYNDPYDARTQTVTADHSSLHTYQTSGVLAEDPSGRRNAHGQTEAEIVAFDYQLSSPKSPTSGDADNLARQPSVKSAHGKSYAASNTDAMTYIDEDFNYYSSKRNSKPIPDRDSAHLVSNAADMGRKDTRDSRAFNDLEYQDPTNVAKADANKSGFRRFLESGRYPIEQRIEDKKRGIGRQKHPFVVWVLTTIMVAVFIYELVVNGRQQGSPISLKPVVNPMLGPSSSALINLGARFPPCMKEVADVPPTLLLPCMNNTANPPDRVCPISELCGFGGISDGTPNQWFRFITPIFLHAGIIHLLLNMLAQMMISAQVEREMGSAGFFLLYFAAGIFGNVLGGNFSLVGIPSVGASGAIFGTAAVAWVDLFTHWRYHYKPTTKLVFMIIELIIGIGIGFIPYVDNFAHIGGFVMGILFGVVFYPVICTTNRRRTVMWILRIAATPVIVILFVLLIRNFYTSDPYAACSGCRYLSCIPTNANNHCKGTGITMTPVGGSNSLRRLLI